MEFGYIYFCAMLFVESHTLVKGLESTEQNDAVSNQTADAYSVEKYSLESFERDKRNITKDFDSGSQSISDEEWLVMIKSSLSHENQESHFQRKRKRNRSKKKRFLAIVKKGDILITDRGGVGFTGHAAIMSTDYWVLEMAGGRNWKWGIKDNNRQVSKDRWYKERSDDRITVYRFPDKTIAHQAATWADRNYYNPNGGSKKCKHITYKITTDFESTNPSYSSKLVLQAYYFGPSEQVAREPVNAVIVPTNLPAYFLPPYSLVNKGTF